MKICLVAPVSGWRGGVHQYSAHLANSLADRAEVEVVGYKSIFPLWLYPGHSKRLSGEVSVRKEIPVHEILKYYSVLSSFKAATVIRDKVRPDVVDIQWIAPQHGLVLIPLISLLRRRPGAKIFLTVHNVLPHEPWIFDRALSRWTFKLSDRLLVHAQAMKEEILRNFREEASKIAIIPHGICTNGDIGVTRAEARERLGIKEKHVILFFGFVRPYKGLDDLLASFKVLANKFDAALVIAGEFFAGLAEYQKELERNGIARRTYLFPRYIPYEEVALFFSAADIVVQPYARFSGQSGVTQTAYLHSLPVVATDVGGLPELILHGKTGLITKPGNPEELTMALGALLEDGDKRQEYGANGKRFLEEQLSWKKVSQRLLDLYAET
jgi:glycosyltransferase involved in cell wall biosynthesis